MINRFPYTNFHELNLDWLIDEVIKLGGDVEKLKEFIASVDVTDEVNNYLDSHLTELVNAFKGTYIVNVADYVEGDLTSDNIVEAINNALAVSERIYIPAGNYTMNLSVTTNCDMYLDDDTTLRTTNEMPIINADNIRFSLHGGKLVSGSATASHVPVWGEATGFDRAMVLLTRCSHGVIENVKVPYARHGACFRLFNCEYYDIHDLDLNNYLFAGVLLVDTCRHISVHHSSFRNIYNFANTVEAYSYAVACGLAETDLSYNAEPVSDIKMYNNFVFNGDDCGLDCHGGCNIDISNNMVINTVNAISAYNDNSRVGRPTGWKMFNVNINNNFCQSNKPVPDGTKYPHPYVFLGSSLKGADFDTFSNCYVTNNYFSSPNNYRRGGNNGTIHLNLQSKNVYITNNYIDSQNQNRATRFCNTINFVFENNVVKNSIGNGMIQGVSSVGKFDNNSGARSYSGTRNPAIFTNATNTLYQQIPLLVEGGKVYQLTASNAYIYKQIGYKMRTATALHAEYPRSLEITVSNGIASYTNSSEDALGDWLKGMAVTINDTEYYIYDNIAYDKFIVAGLNGAPIDDGTYTATITPATPTAL